MVSKKEMEVDGWNTVHYDGSKVGGQMTGTGRTSKVNTDAIAEGVANVLTKVMADQEEIVETELKELEHAIGDEDALEKLRRQRIVQMKALQNKHQQLDSLGHGKLTTVVDEKDFFTQSQKSSKVVCHFFTSSNRRCDIVDTRLTELAATYKDIKCIRIDAEKSPFVSDRLQIFMIPSIVLIRNGKTEHTLQGFDELGGSDNWALKDLVRVLVDHELVTKKQSSKFNAKDASATSSVMLKSKRWNTGDDESSDWE